MRLSRSFLGSNYLTVVSVYSLLLLSEVCFWNSFGFDRSAAQIYFVAPVPFWVVLVGKNVSAVFFIAFEIAAITLVCALAGMPVTLARMAEAYSVAALVACFFWERAIFSRSIRRAESIPTRRFARARRGASRRCCL